MLSSKAESPDASSTKLWATASKEWVIQPKPKPGRKPKRDVVPSKADEDVDKGRRVQNRAAQRAFRERKQSQLAELQARVQSYEQGEIERNVALQNIAKRLKEENEVLRQENAALKEKVARLESDHDVSRETTRKRWRDSSPASNNSAMPRTVSKKSKPFADSLQTRIPLTITTYAPSPPSMVSSPDSNTTSDSRCSPLPYEIPHDAVPPDVSSYLDFASAVKTASIDPSQSFSTFNCGFCSDDTPCVCREIAAQQVAERITDLKDAVSQTNALLHSNHTIRLETPLAASRASILENLPAYQPPVPLRRRPANTTTKIFPITPAPPLQGQMAPASCSGDPSNCLACADDAFGKAFCSAVAESIASQPLCANCPCNKDSNSSSLAPFTSSAETSDSSSAETIPTNDAWRQLKAHPNVEFSDLSLLADVVVRNSKCSGPRIYVSPTLETPIPSLSHTPDLQHTTERDHSPVLLTDPHAHYREREQARTGGVPGGPKLVPQDVLVKCGRQEMREVRADAVQAALRMLDAKFS